MTDTPDRVAEMSDEKLAAALKRAWAASGRRAWAVKRRRDTLKNQIRKPNKENT